MNMKKRNSMEYEVFGSKLRGTDEVENIVKTIIQKKQTPANLRKLAKAVSIEWKHTEENVSQLNLSFSKFEEKLEKNKQEISEHLAKQKASSGDNR